MSEVYFSVVLPTNTIHDFLDTAIQSVFQQTYPHFELIIVVNGEHHEQLKNELHLQYGHHPQIRLLSTPVSKLPFALNLGIHAAKGSFVVRMDGDDICLPNRLAVLAQSLKCSPSLDVVGSNYQIIDAHGKLGQVSKQIQTNREIRKRLPFKCELAHPTLCLRRTLLLQLGGYMYGVASEDYDLWLRMLRLRPAVQFANVPDVLLRYRFHAGQATSKSRIGEFVAHDLGLRLRELLLTGNPVFLLGMLRSLVQYVYRKFARR